MFFPSVPEKRIYCCFLRCKSVLYKTFVLIVLRQLGGLSTFSERKDLIILRAVKQLHGVNHLLVVTLLVFNGFAVFMMACCVLQVFGSVSKAVVVAIVQVVSDIWWKHGPHWPLGRAAAWAVTEVQWAAHVPGKLGIRLGWIAVTVAIAQACGWFYGATCHSKHNMWSDT